MMDLAGSVSEQNLKKAIVGEHQAFFKFLRIRNVADVTGPPEVAELWRATALLRGGHPKVDQLFKNTLLEQTVGLPGVGASAVPMDKVFYTEGYWPGWYGQPQVTYTQADVDRYTQYSATARSEGFTELADWFTKLAAAEHSQL
jgi:rubrerythrin